MRTAETGIHTQGGGTSGGGGTDGRTTTCGGSHVSLNKLRGVNCSPLDGTCGCYVPWKVTIPVCFLFFLVSTIQCTNSLVAKVTTGHSLGQCNVGQSPWGELFFSPKDNKH